MRPRALQRRSLGSGPCDLAFLLLRPRGICDRPAAQLLHAAFRSEEQTKTKISVALDPPPSPTTIPRPSPANPPSRSSISVDESFFLAARRCWSSMCQACSLLFMRPLSLLPPPHTPTLSPLSPHPPTLALQQRCRWSFIIEDALPPLIRSVTLSVH